MESLTDEQAKRAVRVFLDAQGWGWLEDNHSFFLKGIRAVARFVDSLHKHSLEERILKELRENNHLLHHVIRILTSHRILGGVMSQIGDPMNLIAPGSTVQFGVTPTPAGVATLAAQVIWSGTASDGSAITVIPNAGDAAGLTATVVLPDTIAVDSELDVFWSYTNADGTVADVIGKFTVVAVVPPVVNVTGGTMAQIA
jgi:hypothetical protein